MQGHKSKGGPDRQDNADNPMIGFDQENSIIDDVSGFEWSGSAPGVATQPTPASNFTTLSPTGQSGPHPNINWDAPGVQGDLELLITVAEKGLSRNPQAQEYLHGQRKLNKAVVEDAHLGYLDDAALSQFKSSRRTDAVHADHLARRILIPTLDGNGSVRAVSGRAISADAEKKYLHLRGSKRTLFGINLLPSTLHEIALFEGQIDVLAARQASVFGVAFGGSNPTAKQWAELLELFKDRGLKRVVVAGDWDPASETGQTASRALCDKLLEHGFFPRLIHYPPGLPSKLDPAEIVANPTDDIATLFGMETQPATHVDGEALLNHVVSKAPDYIAHRVAEIDQSNDDRYRRELLRDVVRLLLNDRSHAEVIRELTVSHKPGCFSKTEIREFVKSVARETDSDETIDASDLDDVIAGYDVRGFLKVNDIEFTVEEREDRVVYRAENFPTGPRCGDNSCAIHAHFDGSVSMVYDGESNEVSWVDVTGELGGGNPIDGIAQYHDGCPIPSGYEIEDGILYDGKNTLLSRAVWVVADVIDIETGKTELVIRWDDGDDTREAQISRADLVMPSMQSKPFVDLLNRGLPVTSKNMKNFAEYIDRVPVQYLLRPRRFTVRTTGWHEHGGCRFFQLGTAIGTDIDVRLADRALASALKPRGSYQIWGRAVLPRLRQPEMFFAFAFSLVPIIQKFITGDSNQLVHIWGDSTKGKTTAQRLCASAHGNPQSKDILRSWSATSNAVMKLLEQFRDLPLIIDEASIAEIRGGGRQASPTEIAYRVFAGRDKDRLDSNSELKQASTFRTCVLSSGESRLPTDVGNTGQAIRLLQCEWPGFDGDYDGTVAFDAERIVSDNYGHFTPRLIQRVLETVTPSELMTKIRTYGKVTAEVLTKAGGAPDTAGRQGRLLAPVVVMGELVVEQLRDDFGSSELQAVPLIAEFIRRHVVDLSARPLHERIPAYFDQQVAVHRNKFHSTDGIGSDVSHGECWGVINDGYVFVIGSKIDELLEDAFKRSQVLSAMEKVKRLIRSGDRPQSSHRLPGLKSPVSGYKIRVGDVTAV